MEVKSNMPISLPPVDMFCQSPDEKKKPGVNRNSVNLIESFGYVDIDMQTFGEWLRQRRVFLKLTQDQLAERAGVSKPYISRLERGSKHTESNAAPAPRPDTIRGLARALQLSEKEVWNALGSLPYNTNRSTNTPLEQSSPREDLAALFYEYGELDPEDLEELSGLVTYLRAQIKKRRENRASPPREDQGIRSKQKGPDD